MSWRDPRLERRLAAWVIAMAAVVTAGIAGAWGIGLAAVYIFAPSQIESDLSTLWPVLNLTAAAPFAWVCARLAGSARTYAVEATGGRAAIRWFAIFYASGTIWTGIAVPLFGLAVPLLYAPMAFAALGVLLLFVRLLRAARS